MEQAKFIVDKTLCIEVPPDKYLNEYNALYQLKNGLIALYNSVRPHELKIIEENKGAMVHVWGRHPAIPEHLFNLLPCFFHWFGTSVCNYSRLVGFIVSREQGIITEADLQLEPSRNKIKDACNDYMKNLLELQEVLKWRNKVSAHFALTDPRRDDNIATLEASIIYPVGFEYDRFRTGTMTFSRGDAMTNYSSEIPRWGLTEVFETLAPRFWPEIIFNP
ncbi:MAG: hypothetical protein JNK20_13550 [Flavipsychrobacter sp.]|nr:hypothetical protein [Flavipsychrobacter sp.]